MAKKKIYMDELTETSEKLINYSQVNIHDKINEIKLLVESIPWEGPAHDKYLEGFNKEITDIQNLNSRLELLGKYLTHAHDNYENANNDINKSWDKFMEEIEEKNECV